PVLIFHFCFFLIRRPPRSTLFPYTTLFRSFFRVLGIGPIMGRGFLPEEDRPNGPRVVIISDGLWRSYFGADPAFVGKEALLNGRDRKSTRLNSSHLGISYAVFCLKKKSK